MKRTVINKSKSLEIKINHNFLSHLLVAGCDISIEITVHLSGQISRVRGPDLDRF